MAEIKSFEDLKQTAEAVAAEPVAVREPQRDKFGRAYATGRRKDASARVWLKAGSGKVYHQRQRIGRLFHPSRFAHAD